MERASEAGETLKKMCAAYDDEITRFYAGDSFRAYEFFGCHYIGEADAHLFAVWAPNARSVRVAGDFNGWGEAAEPMETYRGIHVALIPGLKDGDAYKYSLEGVDGTSYFKADPFAFHAECPPGTASRVCTTGGYTWNDAAYLASRGKTEARESPVAIYEVNLASWRKFGTVPESESGPRYPDYREIADALA
ncbi:MAG: hypothetical protein LBC58_05925, partial [Clostridiales Family XIII bacterium]|nr:hypothetical protein [Clostridiales Family XIII bacterium]